MVKLIKKYKANIILCIVGFSLLGLGISISHVSFVHANTHFENVVNNKQTVNKARNQVKRNSKYIVKVSRKMKK